MKIHRRPHYSQPEQTGLLIGREYSITNVYRSRLKMISHLTAFQSGLARSATASLLLATVVVLSGCAGQRPTPLTPAAIETQDDVVPAEPASAISGSSNDGSPEGTSAGNQLGSGDANVSSDDLEAGQLQGANTKQAQRRVATLASRAFAGRGYLFDGHTKAAEFIAAEFDAIGLSQVNDSWYQPFDLEADLFPSTPSLSIDSRELSIGIDFLPLPGSASGSTQNLEIISLNHGMYAPDQNLDDYTGELQGKIVIVDEGYPDSLTTTERSGAGTTEYKAFVAASKGAAALIVAKDNLVYGLSRDNTPIPVFEIKRTAINNLPQFASFSSISNPNAPVQTRNVLGYLAANEGQLSDSLILVVAHYDHQGALGDGAFFPGANDNASGVALMLDVAEILVDRQDRKQDVLFVGFSGEEVGLLGSKAFIRSPPIDLDRISLLVNLDMVASAEDGVVVMGGVENVEEFEQLTEIVEHLNQANGSAEQRRIRPRNTTPISDHYPFFDAGIKSLYLYTNKGTQPYHSILDKPETLEWDDYVFARALVVEFLNSKLLIDD